MDVPLDNFLGVKLKKAYKEREKIAESGIYYHDVDKTFDLVHVSFNHTGEVRQRSIVTRIPEQVAFADAGKMYIAAKEQLDAFSRRVAVKRTSERGVSA